MTAYSHVHRRAGTDESGAPVQAGDMKVAEGDWSSIWFELRQRAFRTLAVVPADDYVDAREVVRALGGVARIYENGGVALLDATGLTLATSRGRREAVESAGRQEGRVFIAVDPPRSAPAALPVARAADAAVLLVTLEHTRIQDAREVIERIGKDRFVGTVAVAPLGRRARRAVRRARKAAARQAGAAARDAATGNGSATGRGAAARAGPATPRPAASAKTARRTS